MSAYYRDLIREGSAFGIAKALQKKTYSMDHEDIIHVLEASMWIIDELQDKIEKLQTQIGIKRT